MHSGTARAINYFFQTVLYTFKHVFSVHEKSRLNILCELSAPKNKKIKKGSVLPSADALSLSSRPWWSRNGRLSDMVTGTIYNRPRYGS